MVQDKEELGPLVLDDRITLPPREKMDPEFRKLCEDVCEDIYKRHDWKRRKKASHEA